MTDLLDVVGISKAFGDTRVLGDVSFTVRRGEVVALVGTNGSGKTTALNIIGRLIDADSGDVRLDGESLFGLRPHKIAGRGIGRVFQLSRVSSPLRVADEIALASYWRDVCAMLPRFLMSTGRRNEPAHPVLPIAAVLEALELSGVVASDVESLPYAQKRYTELARAIGTADKLLILDELTSGLTATERSPIQKALQLCKKAGLGVLLVDHDMSFVSGSADRCVLLDGGQVRAEGPTGAILSSVDMRRLYLGPDGVHAC